jgi:hypothetical protein
MHMHMRAQVRARMARVLRRGPRLQTKLGEVVYKGHYSYSLMLELQLGIRYTVGRGLWPRPSHGSSSAAAGLWGLSSVLAPWGSMSGGRRKEERRAQRQQLEAAQKQQQQQQSAQRGRHVRQLSDALTPEGVLRALEPADYKQERFVYFPSCGRCVLRGACVAVPWSGSGCAPAKATAPCSCCCLVHLCAPPTLQHTCAHTALPPLPPPATHTHAAPRRPHTPPRTLCGRTMRRACSGGCARQRASTRRTTC